MKEDYLHPGISTSLVSGWTIYEDPPKRPAHMIYEWSANWKDKADNIVTYQFQYKDPIDKHRHGTVILETVQVFFDCECWLYAGKGCQEYARVDQSKEAKA